MDELTPCGAEDLDPVRPDNRPNLPEIAYRIGTQPEFLARMHWRIPRQPVFDAELNKDLKPLAPLRARDSSDPTLALMDSFACSLDVLTFYSERVANEGYIGTAVQRRSMIELARAIGYRFAPGVAASVQLAFTVEDSDDPYRAVEVPSGVQAMSVPKAKDELPQIFETVESILARAEWNAMPARTEQDQNLALYWNKLDPDDEKNGRLYLFDLDNSFDVAADDPDVEAFATAASLASLYPVAAGLDLEASLEQRIEDHGYNEEVDPRLRAVPVDEIYLRGVGLGLKAGQRLIAVGVKGQGADRDVVCGVLRVISATDDRAFGITILVATPYGEAPVAVRRPPRFRLPILRLLRMPVERIQFNAANVHTMVRAASWSGEALSAVVRTQAWPRAQLMRMIRMPRLIAVPETSEAQPGLYVMRDDSGFFGCTAPLQEMLAKTGESRGTDPYTVSWDKTAPRTVWVDSQGTRLRGATQKVPGPAHVFLEREIKEILPDGWAVMENPDQDVRVFRVAAASTEARSDFALNGKATGIVFTQPNGDAVISPEESVSSPLNAFTFRTARLYGASQPLPLSGTPIREDVASGALTIDLASLYLDIERGRSVSISGNRTDSEGLVGSETLNITEVEHIGGHTRLMLEAGPDYSYARPSVRLNANTALATHGEFFAELLGSGDASVPNQLFTLAKKPLTFVAADTPDGRASTLTIRVDGIEWHEAATLYDSGPYDRAYEVRLEDDGSTKVCFGDGIKGHRLPTGTSNVTASYRTGIGLAGEVADEAIIHLKTRPLGVRSVTNPSPASGAGEAETLADARARAPQSVRILGRIVSITDYQDFAVSFAGIGKARADMLWSGQAQLVYLTVAPESDSLLDEAAPVMARLRAAADQIRDGTDTVVIAPYQRRYFQLSAKLYRHPDYLAEDVAAAAHAALLAGFGYTRRALAQPVSGAEAIALLQAVPGVIGVDLDVLALLDSGDPNAPAPDTLASVLPALPARVLDAVEGGGLIAAELLTILDSAINLIVEDAHA